MRTVNVDISNLETQYDCGHCGEANATMLNIDVDGLADNAAFYVVVFKNGFAETICSERFYDIENHIISLSLWKNLTKTCKESAIVEAYAENDNGELDLLVKTGIIHLCFEGSISSDDAMIQDSANGVYKELFELENELNANLHILSENIIKTEDATANAYKASSDALTAADYANEIAEVIDTAKNNGEFKGEKGDKGDKGDAFTYADFTVEQLAGLKGPKGDKGDKGETGDRGFNGLDGADGKSAYELAAENGFDGSVEEYLLSLKGAQGETGKDGAAGPQGPKGEKGEPGTTDYNSLEHQPIVELEVEEGTNIADFHIGLWKMKSDVMITDSENSQVYLCAGDIVKIYGVVADDIEFTSAYSILSADWSAVGNIDDPIAQSLIINKNDLLTLTDDTLNDKSDFPVSNKAVTTELNSLKTKIERPSQFYFSPKTNTEYRFGTIYSPVAELEMDNGFAFGSDFISGLVFVSGETPTEFTYSKNIKFTGDDCNDNVFVPTAEKIYDIVFWSNDCGLQAVVRGVDR